MSLTGSGAAQLNEVWNQITGRAPGTDGRDDEMENWVLKTAEQPLECRQLQELFTWRNQHIAHQELQQTRARYSGFEVYPMRPPLRAYWAVMKAAHRTFLLGEGTGLHGLMPTPQFSVTRALSDGKLMDLQISVAEEKLLTHAGKWERLLAQAEERWYRELRELRRGRRQED